MTRPSPLPHNNPFRAKSAAAAAQPRSTNESLEDPALTEVQLPTGWFGSLLFWLAREQARHTRWFLVLAALCTFGSVPIAARLTLNGAFEAMLPNTAPSVVDLAQLIDKFGVASNLTIAVKAPDRKTAFAATKALTERIKASHDPALVSVDSGFEQFERFVEANRHLYADLDFLRAFQRDLHARVEWEAEHESPFDLGLDEDIDVKEPPTIEQLKRRLKQEGERAQKSLPHYEDGVFSHASLPVAVIVLRTNITSAHLDQTAGLISRMDAHFAEVQKEPRFRGAVRLYGADLMDVYSETKMLAKQMAFAGLATLIAVMLAVYVFFRSFRAVPVLGLCIIPPVAMTFAAAQLSVGFLNTSTAFLMSIVIGNGINPNVIWLARYFEERLAGHPHEEAIRTTHAATWQPTLIASLAAGLAYASLAITDFRGFRDFGIIGGIGMALCWVGAFTILPALVLASERLAPLRPEKLAKLRSNPYGRFFSWLAFSRPRLSVVTGGAITALSIVAVWLAILADPIEYDFRNLISERPADSEINWVNRMQGEILNETGTGSAVAILAPSRAQTSEVVDQLEAYGATHPDVLGPVRDIDSLRPADQEQKLPIISDLRADLLRARKFAKGQDKDDLEKQIPAANIRAIGDNDLPGDVRRTFTEKDGTVGRLVYSETHSTRNAWDGRYWMEWATAVRSVNVDGQRPPSTGTALVFADVLHSLAKDGPLAIGAALISTVLLLIFSQKSWRNRLLTLSALMGGMVWMAGAMAGVRIRLNFLNFLAFPITFGNGADYGINVIARYAIEERRVGDAKRALKEAVERTGGAVVLCSLTTIIGYISLYTSSNKALNSFGVAMAISEITCVATAVLIMPAWMAMRLGGKTPASGQQVPGASEDQDLPTGSGVVPQPV